FSLFPYTTLFRSKGLAEQRAGLDTRNSSDPSGNDNYTYSKSPSTTLSMELRSWARLVSGHDTARIQEPPSQPTSGLSHLADRNHCLNYSKPPICHLILDLEQSNHTPKSCMTSWCIADAIF